MVEQTTQSASAEKARPAAAPKPIVAGLPRSLWTDPDVRWLTGVHDAGKHTWFVCEPYEELLWWLQMPALLGIASEPAPSKAKLQALSEKVHTASAEADKVEYRLDALLAPETPSATEPSAEEPRAAAAQKNPRHESVDTADADTKVAEKSTVKEDQPAGPKK
jgi:hypothetical protein